MRDWKENSQNKLAIHWTIAVKWNHDFDGIFAFPSPSTVCAFFLSFYNCGLRWKFRDALWLRNWKRVRGFYFGRKTFISAFSCNILSIFSDGHIFITLKWNQKTLPQIYHHDRKWSQRHFRQCPIFWQVRWKRILSQKMFYAKRVGKKLW